MYKPTLSHNKFTNNSTSIVKSPLIESEEGIEPSTQNEERPRGQESNLSHQTLILQYTKKSQYNTTLKM